MHNEIRISISMRLCGPRSPTRIPALYTEWRTVDDPSDYAAEDWRGPEQPELLDGPGADEECRRRAAGWIDRKIGDRYADEMNERQSQADGDGSLSVISTSTPQR